MKNIILKIVAWGTVKIQNTVRSTKKQFDTALEESRKSEEIKKKEKDNKRLEKIKEKERLAEEEIAISEYYRKKAEDQSPEENAKQWFNLFTLIAIAILIIALVIREQFF